MKKRLVFYSLIVSAICLGIFFLGSKIKSEDIILFVEKAGFWAPVFYIILMFITYIIAPLSGTPVLLAGYTLFKNKVQIYGYFAFLLGAMINFWLARKFGRKLVSKLVGEKNMEKIDQFTQEYGIKSLIFLRVLQGHLHDFISYAYGLTNMGFVSYIIVSALAPIPWIMLWQLYLFKRISDIKEFTTWILITLIPPFIFSFLFASKFKKEG